MVLIDSIIDGNTKICKEKYTFEKKKEKRRIPGMLNPEYTWIYPKYPFLRGTIFAMVKAETKDA